MIKIKVELNRSILYIPVKLWSSAENIYKNALTVFDTGAAMTCISEKAAEIAGYEIDRTYRARVTTGSGTIEAYYTIIPDLQLAGISIGPVLAQVIKFPDELQASALLGLNVIKEFSVNMDFVKNTETNKTVVDIDMTPKFDITNLCTVDNFNMRSMDQRFGDICIINN